MARTETTGKNARSETKPVASASTVTTRFAKMAVAIKATLTVAALATVARIAMSKSAETGSSL
jgi:hypothetical protein